MSDPSRPASSDRAPESPALPRPDPDHEERTVAAIARALRDIPFYGRRASPRPGATLRDVLATTPLLGKDAVRATLPKQWVPPGRDARAELASGALELVETSGSTGERARILWDEGWWPRQETRGMRTCAPVAAALDRPDYRESVLATAACGLGACHVGDVPYAERLDGHVLFLNQRQDPLYWSDDEQTRILDELGQHATVGLESDPFYLSLLARFARERGRTLDVQGFVQLTYALPTRAQLREIRGVFEGRVLQLYGASEVGVLFMEGDDGRLHHCPFTTHVELVPVRVPTPGATDVALVVVTTIDRMAMPLVRFVVEDLVQVDRAGPRVWTSVPPLVSVEGRVDDALVLPDGALVTAGALDRALGDLDGVRVWQVNQRATARVEIDVVADGDGAAWAGRVVERLRPLLAGLEVSARPVTAIPLEASGKHRVSRRHVPIDHARCFAGA